MRISTGTAIRLATAAAMTLALGTFQPALAQTKPQEKPSPTQPQQKPSPQKPSPQAQLKSPVEGDLVSVDADKMIITVKTTQGQQVQIAYNDKTEVSGAQKGVAGLATMKEGRVTVHFTEDPAKKTRVATRIIVQPK